MHAWNLAMPLIVLALNACAPAARPVPTIRICDPDGCTNRPTDFETFRPSQDDVDTEVDARIAALEQLAKRNPSAAYDLGLRFFRGDGVRQDSYRALVWMRDAAGRGDLAAQKAVGRLYLTGLGEMGADPREAHRWLTIAAGRGDREAATLLREAVRARESEDEGEQWRVHWQPVFYTYWASSYRYRWWWGGAWYLY